MYNKKTPQNENNRETIDLCPECFHELEENCEVVSIDDDGDFLLECIKYCTHCDYESDFYYEA